MSVNKITKQYKGFDIVCDTYLWEPGRAKKYYWEVYKDGKMIADTLYNDDKMWDENNVLISAMLGVDNYLLGVKSVYFNQF